MCNWRMTSQNFVNPGLANTSYCFKVKGSHSLLNQVSFVTQIVLKIHQCVSRKTEGLKPIKRNCMLVIFTSLGEHNFGRSR